jgi:hypothetical protein
MPSAQYYRQKAEALRRLARASYRHRHRLSGRLRPRMLDGHWVPQEPGVKRPRVFASAPNPKFAHS